MQRGFKVIQTSKVKSQFWKKKIGCLILDNLILLNLISLVWKVGMKIELLWELEFTHTPHMPSLQHNPMDQALHDM